MCAGRRGHGAVAADVEVRRDVRRGADAEEAVEAAIDRSAAQRLVVAVLRESEMPLPDHGGGVARAAKHRGEGDLSFVDQRPGRPLADVGPERVAPGHQPVARRVAQRPRRVGIGEAHALGRETVDMRRRDLRVRVVGAQVPVAHVIDEDDDDMRGTSRQGRAGQGCHQQREQQVADAWHQGQDRVRYGHEAILHGWPPPSSALPVQ